MRPKILFLICILCLSSCATVENPSMNDTAKRPIEPLCTQHTIQKGETLWRISKLYGVDINDLIEKNNIQDYTTVTPEQVLLIPSKKNHPPRPETIMAQKNNIDFIWPIRGKISGYFRQKSNGVTNKGIDILLENNQDVLASCEGEVVFTGNLAGYGKTLIINHAENLSTIYCGNSDITVKKGQKVIQGMVIAKSGVSPRKNQPTLHFEIRKKHKPQDPLFYLN